MFDKLSPREIHVWTVRLDDSNSSIACHENLLSMDERNRAQRFVREEDRRRFVVSHSALRSVLARYCGACPESLQFDIGEFGKPNLAGRSDIQFSLSHSDELTMIAVRRGARLGVDVEKVRPDISDEALAERFFSTGELRRLRLLNGDARIAGFFRCWTRKEAYLKALGCGISDADLSAVEVSFLPEEEPQIIQRSPRDHPPAEWAVFHLEPRSGFVAAIVAEGSDLELSFMDWACDPAVC